MSDVTPLRLKKLVIHSFGGLAAPTALDFADGMNVLVGENGGGKTTLLKLIVAIIRGEPQFLRAHGVDAEVTLEAGDLSIAYRLVVERAAAGPSPEPTEAKPRAWSVDGAIVYGKNRLTWSWGSDRALEVPVIPRPRAIPATPEPNRFGIWIGASYATATLNAPAGEGGSFLQAAARVGRFDEQLGAFAAIRGIGSPDECDLVAPRAVRATDGASSVSDWPLPLDVNRPMEDQKWLSDDGGWLAEVGARFGCRFTVRPAKVTADLDNELANAAEIQVSWPDGTRASADTELSFGQKRLFSLYWYLQASRASPLIADELVNGFHHGWIEDVIAKLAPRQAIVSVQNPLLLDQLSFDTPEDVRLAVTICRMSIGADGRRSWSWEKPSAEQATRFHEGWMTGISHVSTVLKAEGLW